MCRDKLCCEDLGYLPRKIFIDCSHDGGLGKLSLPLESTVSHRSIDATNLEWIITQVFPNHVAYEQQVLKTNSIGRRLPQEHCPKRVHDLDEEKVYAWCIKTLPFESLM